MNGIALLVLVLAAGQVTAAPAKTQNRDWGWEVDKEGVLCYIVQLSPQKVAEMQDTGWEYPSDMPEELVGRATRVVIRIGTALLPQSPSLEELKQMPRIHAPGEVTAQLGPGRISDVESTPLYNVQQERTTPALPSIGGGGGGSPAPLDPAGNLANQAQQASEALAEKMRNLVRGTPEIPGGLSQTTTLPPGGSSTAAANDSPPLPGFPGAGLPNKFNTPTAGNTDPRATAATGENAGGWQSAPQGTQSPQNYDERTRGDMARLDDNRNPGSSPAGNYQQPRGGYGQEAYNGGYVDPRDPAALGREMFNGLPNRQTPVGSFGSFNGGNPGNYVSAGQPNGYGREMYGTPGYNNPNLYPPSGLPPGGTAVYPTDPATRLANNPAAAGGGTGNLPSTTAAPAATTPAPPPATESTTAGGGSRLPTEKSPSQNILPVFFLLSLVVNLYLGWLISKLLKRYRALLASMRGQTTTNAYSS